MKLSVLLALLIYVTGCAGQSVHESLNAICLQTSKYSNRQASPFYFMGNPSVLGYTKQKAVGVYTERRFLLNELSSFQATAILPVKHSGFGAMGSRYGSPLYNETMVAISYGRCLINNVSVGVQLNYLSRKSPGFGIASTATASAGALFRPNPTLSAGFAAQHI
ncbi:MAG: hypothetical protein EOO88_48965, partial [Pedobacter sp.]